MAGNIWNTEWYNLNAQRNYPLADDVSRQDTSTSFTLPNDFIVDFKWAIHATMDINPAKFFVKSLSAFGQGYVLTFGYDDEGTTELIASVSILSASHTKNQTYRINGLSDSEHFFDSSGAVTIGSLDTLAQYAGVYNFEVANSRLNPATIVPDIKAVTGIRIKNSASEDPSELLQGDITLVAGQNILISTDGPTKTITINAAPEDYLQACDCNYDEEGSCIQTINNVQPDEAGNINLVTDTDCLQISPQTSSNSIKLSDNCCEPCCGCEDLVVITAELKNMRDQIANLERYSDSLQQAVTNLQLIIPTTQIGGV